MAKEQLNLGQLIELLKRRDQTQQCLYDFAGMIPTALDSYRGFYDHLALGHATCGRRDDNQRPTVANVLAELKHAIGREYSGWKGGEYLMTADTPLWVDNPGECSSTAIVGIAEYEYATILETRTRWLDV